MLYLYISPVAVALQHPVAELAKDPIPNTQVSVQQPNRYTWAYSQRRTYSVTRLDENVELECDCDPMQQSNRHQQRRARRRLPPWGKRQIRVPEQQQHWV